jgi:hypothetical protein
MVEYAVGLAKIPPSENIFYSFARWKDAIKLN